MSSHGCKAVAVTCIDYRFQGYIDKWLKDHFRPGTFDRVALAGGIKNIDIVLEQVGISHRLHHIKKVVLINHEDCGAYGQESTLEKHSEDLKIARTRINEIYPDLIVETYYLHLDGKFESTL